MRYCAFSSSPVLLAVLTFFLSACTVLGPADDDWPAQAPDQSFFRSVYTDDSANQEVQSEDEYLTWAERFYTGMNMVPGWLEGTERVLQRVESEEQQALLREHMESLGREIGAEWAKDNSLRLIDSRAVNIWRQALEEALDQNDLPGFLDRLEEDIDLLLAEELSADEIYFERYYEDEFSF